MNKYFESVKDWKAGKSIERAIHLSNKAFTLRFDGSFFYFRGFGLRIMRTKHGWDFKKYEG